MKYVIGTVPYLNEKPLTRWFFHTEEGRASDIEVVSEVPSRLAEMLKAGEISAALVSSFEYFRTPGYEVVPDVSISSQDEILAVRAFAQIPWRNVQTLALDTSSLTSVALVKILLAEQYNSHPQFFDHAPDLPAMLAVADAALLIGDKGMLADSRGLYPLDLGEAWRRLTGLPFVYAVWLANPATAPDHLTKTLQTAKAWGLTQLEEIAQEEAVKLQCPVELCRRYLTSIMDYDLDDTHIEALTTFGTKAHALGLLTQPPAPVKLIS